MSAAGPSGSPSTGAEVDLELALARVREAAEACEATQFETITAAALAAFAAAKVEVAVVEAGLGGRYDATNVLDTRVVLLTNVSARAHRGARGYRRGDRCGEARGGATRGDRRAARTTGSRDSSPTASSCALGGPREAVESFVGHAVAGLPEVVVPGRLERRPGEIRDGAHNPDGVRWLIERLRPARFTLCVSVVADKAVDVMLAELSQLGDTLVATRSSSERALGAADLAERARAHFATVEAVADPHAALARAHELGEPVLVTGSLYLLADLASGEAPG